MRRTTLIALHFNAYQFTAALGGIRRLPAHATPRQQAIFPLLDGLCVAYQAWDHFDHKQALHLLRKLSKDLAMAAKTSEKTDLIEFARQVEVGVKKLEALEEHTQHFKRAHLDLVGDLTANADRRAEEHKYDDAVARLYRAPEMIGQIHLEARLRCDTSAVPPDKIPESLREEYSRKYMDRNSGKLRLGLDATFRVLLEMGCAEVEAYGRNEQAFRDARRARNDSILAHGKTPATPDTFSRFRSLMVESFGLKVSCVFPRLPEIW